MTNEKLAAKTYHTLCKALDNMKWRYEKDEKGLIVRTSAVGDDLSMKLFIKVNADNSVMYLKSAMPFTVPEDKRDLFCRAAIVANWQMLNGSFEMDVSDGYLAFKLVVPFMNTDVSVEVCNYMIKVSCSMVDKFNDKFKDLADGKMTLSEFEAFADKALG